ncbi:MAG: GIY-YIG nuclease family protein [Thiovulaceae bacterium]|nr:GIY-YIG nuclease family protein [Sulfurimonadaceae bacterium]
MNAYLYILASRKNRTLYIGVTSDIIKRIYEHKNRSADGFTEKYDVTLLVYYEIFDDIVTVIERA